ncbi:MAG: hypothetical protein IH859_03615 [Chloroflexi bacterium]|nr:hypothetical protein [Chloroflexota bacterium]
MTVRNQLAQHILGQITMRVDQRTASARLNVLHDAVLEKLALAPAGQADNISVEITHMWGYGKPGEESILPRSAQDQLFVF